jgi:serpin B
VTNLDFRHSPDDARKTINSWVRQKTEGKINEIVPSGYINDLTRLVLTNAVYFNATWIRQSERSLSLNESFYCRDGRLISVPMMRQYGEEARFDYLETEDMQILKMPYDGENLSMIILLPKENNLSHLEGSLCVENLDYGGEAYENSGLISIYPGLNSMQTSNCRIAYLIWECPPPLMKRQTSRD